jgi:hypothetical protein
MPTDTENLFLFEPLAHAARWLAPLFLAAGLAVACWL